MGVSSLQQGGAGGVCVGGSAPGLRGEVDYQEGKDCQEESRRG